MSTTKNAFSGLLHRSLFNLPVALWQHIFEVFRCIPTRHVVFDQDILLETDFWNDCNDGPTGGSPEKTTLPIQSSMSSYEVRGLRKQLAKIKTQLNEARVELNLATQEVRACRFDVARDTSRAGDLEDDLEVTNKRLADQEAHIEALKSENDDLQRRNSALWLINAGLRYDLTEMIVGKEDREMMGDILREVEREEWDELVGETLVEESPRSENSFDFEEDFRMDGKLGRCDKDVDDDAMMDDVHDIIDAAVRNMSNLLVGMEMFEAEE